MAKAAKAKQPLTGKVGHPRLYDRVALVPMICARLAKGEPMTVICRDMGLPVRTVNDWRALDPDVAAQFDQARDEGHDAIAHCCRETARGKGDSTKDVQRDKLIIDTDLKLLAKWDPRRYGERQQLDHTSSDGTMTPAPPMTKEELRETVQSVVEKF